MSEARILDGKAFAARLCARIARQVGALQQSHGLKPGLAAVRVGNDPASEIYVRNKTKQAREAGMNSWQHRLPAEASQDQLLGLIRRLNEDRQVHGILVQLPLPGRIDAGAAIDAVDPAKDVDGFHVINAGRLVTGAADAMVPCTPLGCLMLLKHHLGELAGLKALVIGRSNIVGKPVAALLLAEHCTVTVAHSRTRDLAGECRRADIVVAAVGRARMVEGGWIKPGATVIDVGINHIEGGSGETRLAGDVDFAAAVKVAGAITPVPGGVGPMTIACLLRNTLVAACRQNGIAPPEI